MAVITLATVACSNTSQKGHDVEHAQDNTIPIRAARSLQGETVKVTGVVAVQSGAYASAISSGFAIQDDTAGIYIIDDTENFQLGQTVSVIGVVGEENKQVNIKLQQATLLPGSTELAPQVVQTGKLGESERGYLVTTRGKITKASDDGKYGYKLFINDGSGELQVYLSKSSLPNTFAPVWKPGDVIDVVGFAGVYNGIFEILPRQTSDIETVRMQ